MHFMLHHHDVEKGSRGSPRSEAEHPGQTLEGDGRAQGLCGVSGGEGHDAFHVAPPRRGEGKASAYYESRRPSVEQGRTEAPDQGTAESVFCMMRGAAMPCPSLPKPSPSFQPIFLSIFVATSSSFTTWGWGMPAAFLRSASAWRRLSISSSAFC